MDDGQALWNYNLRYINCYANTAILFAKFTAISFGAAFVLGAGLSAIMNGESRPVVTDELVEFEKRSVEVQDCRKIIDHFKGIHGIYLNYRSTIAGSCTSKRIFIYF